MNFRATKEPDKLRKTPKECREWERDVLLHPRPATPLNRPR